jgi:hypothetical protein
VTSGGCDDNFSTLGLNSTFHNSFPRFDFYRDLPCQGHVKVCTVFLFPANIPPVAMREPLSCKTPEAMRENQIYGRRPRKTRNEESCSSPPCNNIGFVIICVWGKCLCSHGSVTTKYRNKKCFT